jgi:TPR repeat protein
MKNRHCSDSFFRAGILWLLTVLVLTLASAQCAEGSDIDVSELKARAEQGNATAQFYLGIRYAKGQGVPKDPAEAVKWCRKAAEQGYAMAQYILGAMYHYGEGVPKNSVTAYMWYNLAATNGLEKAVELRRSIEQEMTPAQIAEAQRLSAQFVPRKAGAEAPPETSPTPSTISASGTAFFVSEDGMLSPVTMW